MEMEAKYRVEDRQIFADLLQLDTLGPYRLLPAPEPEEQRNTYFDTADRKLDAGRYGLRIRDLGTRRIATLKGEFRIEVEKEPVTVVSLATLPSRPTVRVLPGY